MNAETTSETDAVRHTPCTVGHNATNLIFQKVEMSLSHRLSFWLKFANRYRRTCEVVFIPFVLSIIFWIFLGRFVGGEHSEATWQDNTYLILPIFSFIAKSFSSGQFPYWLNSIVGGIPLYDSPQFSTLYPFYFFGSSLYSSPISASIQVHFLIMFHVWILHLNTYVMLRIFRLPIIASLLGATLFAFSANTFQLLPWINIVAPYSWLPLALGSVYLVFEDKSPRLGLLLGIVSSTLLTTAAPAHALIHLVYCTGVLFATYLIIHRRDRLRLATSAQRLIAIGIVSLLLSAPALVPSLVSAKRTIRWLSLSKTVIGYEKIPFECFLFNQSRPRELANVLFPLQMKHEVGNSFLGIVPVFLVILSLPGARRNWIIPPFLILGLYTLLSSTGGHLGFAHLNYLLPFWNKIREPDRHLVLFGLTFCTLSAFGFQRLTEWLQGASKLDFKRHFLPSAVFVVVLLTCYLVQRDYATRIQDSMLFVSLFSFFGVLAVVRVSGRLQGMIATSLLAAVVIAPQLLLPESIPLIKDSDYFTEANLRSHRVLKEVSKIDNVRDFRVIVEDDQLPSSRWSMNAIYYGLRTFQGYMNPLPNNQFRELFHTFQSKNYFNLLGAKYYVCRPCSLIPLSEFEMLKEIEGYKIYSTEKVRPHYFVVNQIAQTYADMEDFRSKLRGNDDYLQKVFVHVNDLDKFSSWFGSKSNPVRYVILEEVASQNSLKLFLKTDVQAMLVLNEYFQKDWKVKVNGKSQRPIKVNLNQMGVLLPTGISQVHFEYYPSLFVWLLYLRRVVIVVLSGYVLTAAFLNRSEVKAWFQESHSCHWTAPPKMKTE
jgi:hypothetical protein